MGKKDPDFLLERLEWRRDIRNVMGKLSADYTVREEGKIFDRYWSSREDVCLGVNDGWYTGPADVAGYYAALDAENDLATSCIKADFPERLGNLSPEEEKGLGTMAYFPLDTPVIEIADDGQTAKAIFSIRGSYSKVTPSGPLAYWYFGWAAADFVPEDDGWKIWHLLWLHNIDIQCGTSFGAQPEAFEELEVYAPMKAFSMPQPTIPAPLAENYRTDRPFAKSPAVPEPYETFAETFSYGI